MSHKKRAVNDIDVYIVESGELPKEDIDAVAEFIALIAYNNLKKAQKNAENLIEKTLHQDSGDNGYSK